MTSSLVGSEMCIRDRRQVKSVQNLRSNGKDTQPYVLHGTKDAQCTETVSYTHLTLPTICSV
eukprot:8089654-Prorocentrum_lima.AAC.1